MIVYLALIGLALSLYSYYVSLRIRKNRYKPLCDISTNISCSKAFSSRGGRMFLVHNSVVGLLFYVIVFILGLQNDVVGIFYLSIPAVLFSLYLAYVSYFQMKNFCLVCSATYLVNFLILVVSYLRL